MFDNFSVISSYSNLGEPDLFNASLEPCMLELWFQDFSSSCSLPALATPTGWGARTSDGEVSLPSAEACLPVDYSGAVSIADVVSSIEWCLSITAPSISESSAVLSLVLDSGPHFKASFWLGCPSRHIFRPVIYPSVVLLKFSPTFLKAIRIWDGTEASPIFFLAWGLYHHSSSS